MTTWAQWFRDSSDKLLLAGLVGAFLVYNLHLLHDKADDSQVQFMNGLINTTNGALLGMLTSALVRKASTVTSMNKEDPQSGVSTTILKEEQK